MPTRLSSRLVDRFALLIKAIIALLCVMLAIPASAHPHVWISYATVARMQGTTLEAVQEKWVFSRGFPVSMVGDLTGMPKSGEVGSKYTQIFKQQAFDSLKGAGYFTHVFIGGKPARFADAREFNVAIEDGHIVYTFVLPLAEKVDTAHANVQIGIWDDTFFVDFQAPPKDHADGAAVTLNASASKTCTTQSFEDHDHPIFGGAILPLSTKLSC